LSQQRHTGPPTARQVAQNRGAGVPDHYPHSAMTATEELLLSDAPVGSHLCQISVDPTLLATSVARFASAGLRRGDAVLLIAPHDRARSILASIVKGGVDAEDARASGQLLLVDPDSTLATCMRGGSPDLERLKGTARRMLLNVARERTPVVRVYGEMVSMLWQQGYPRIAIELEEYWTELAQNHSLAVFCSYTIDALTNDAYLSDLSEIGRTHSAVLSGAEDARFCAALEVVLEEILGVSFGLILSAAAREQTAGACRLPLGVRTFLWLHENMPSTSALILGQVRLHLRDSLQDVSPRR